MKSNNTYWGNVISYILTIICVVVLCYSTSAQTYKVSATDKKAIKYYYEGRAFIKTAQFQEAIQLYTQAIERDQQFFEAYYGIASCKEKLGDVTSALVFYKKGLQYDPKGSPNVHFAVGNIYYSKGTYDSAITHMMQYQGWNLASKGNLKQADKVITNCKFAIEKMKIPLNYQLKELEAPLNSFATQYFPVLTVDQQQLIFTIRRGTEIIHDEDIFISNKTGNHWTAPVSLSPSINTENNQGANAISADGRKLMFTSCNARDGIGSCDIYVANKVGDDWGVPRNLGTRVNSRSWDSQPSLSPDGRTMYFASNRPGGFGGRDIWKCEQDNYGEWQPAVNLGEEINTPGEETSPFIHANGQTLYFSSDQYIGLGGFDFYKSENLEGKWTTPVNLGYPLNDHEDQISFFMTADGRYAYFSKEEGDRFASRSKLYMFEVPEEIRVKNTSTFLKGVIRDSETKAPLRAQIELYNLNTNKLISRFFSDQITGEYLTVLTKGGEYGLYVKKRGYLFEDSSFDLRQKMLDKPLTKDIYLRPIKVGEKVRLNNLFFAFDKYDLDEKSKVELKEIFKFLRGNPRRVIQIQAHTDNVGSNAYNQELSDKRAKAVFNYLLSKGVPQRMLTYKGFGASQPITDNETEENRRQNRRVDFEIIK